MGDLEDLTRLPDDFDGQVRLFPLPSLVLFPHSMQPLQIFEPRYCEMLADALHSDDLIAIATLTGSQPLAPSQPSIAQTICVGKIVSHVEREEQMHNILLVGIKRAKIVTELDAGRSFRIAKVDILDDVYAPDGQLSRGELRAELLNAFGKVIPATESAKQSLGELLAGGMGLGPITDIIAHTLPISPSIKLKLLGEPNVDRRAAQLIGFLNGGALDASADPTQPSENPANDQGNRLPFPPPFSLN